MVDFLAKLQHIPNRTWMAAGALSALQFVVHDAFFWMWCILAAAMFVDWIAGRCAVRMTHPHAFSRRKSREGLMGKALALIVLALLRGMEAVLPALIPGVHDSLGTKGLLSAIIGIALFIDELDSIDAHRQQLGRGPIPMLSWAIERLRAATGAERRAEKEDGRWIPEHLPDKRERKP